MLHDPVENATKSSRKAQLESYDGCARLRPVWDEIAEKYDVMFTPSVPDEAPVWIKSTGDAVSPPFFTHSDFIVFERVALTSAVKVLLLNVDYSPSSMSQRARLFWRKWSAYWADIGGCEVHGICIFCMRARLLGRSLRRREGLSISCFSFNMFNEYFTSNMLRVKWCWG